MIWVSRVVQRGDDHHIRELFLSQMTALGRPKNMLLVGVILDDFQQNLYICLPDPDLTSSYFGFERIAKSSLPRAPFLLEGNDEVFEDVFHGWN